VWFGGVDVDPFEGSERSYFERLVVEPRAIGEERVATEIGDGGFQMEATGDAHRDNFIAMRSEDCGELADAFGVGACGLADVESAVDAEDVAAFDGAGSGDLMQCAKRGESFREGRGFGLAGFCAEREDDAEFVENDGGIFDEHGIGERWFGGERVDVDAEFGEEMFVGGVLGLGFGDVDGLAVDESELATGESGADGAGDGVEHGWILAGMGGALREFEHGCHLR
jgi:hypothetical protein